MHHPESSGDSTGTRKMAHPAMFPRKGSNTGIGSSSGLTTTTGTNVSNTFIPVEDYQSPLLIQTPPPAGSSSPGPQHPQSLNLISQSQLQTQPLLSAGAQIKKKSGFQITSVTPAQISVSTNNSIAEDTESYDDLDESHTEDLSSSEILDVSLSRATDMGGPERSSSEETLNNFHEAETPGAVSPNQPHFSSQPPHHHPLPQVLQHGTMVNGTKHHPAQSVHSGVAFPPVAVSGGMLPGVPEGGAISAAVTSASGGISSIAQKLPSNMGAIPETATIGTTGIVAQPLTSITQGTVTGMLSAAAGVPISGVISLTSNVSNANRLSSASMPVLGGNSLNSSSSSSSAAMGCSSQNVSMLLKQSGTASTSVALSAAAAAAGGGMGPAGSVPLGVAALGQPSSVTPVQPPQAQVPAPVAASSRFRVVKLDSSSEPFKKGRWICTEYYDKEAPPADGAPSHRPAESSRQPVSESVPCSERESTSGSSVNSAVSTLSHYTESVGSGEMGGPSAVPSFQPPPPQLLDYTSIQASHPSLSQSTSQPQIAPHHPHPQDVVHSLLKASGVPASPALLQQQLTYAQAAQSLPGVAQQQMGYPPAQQPTSAQTAPVPMPASQGSGPPPEFAQHQQISQAGMQARMAAAGQQLVPGAQPHPQGLLQQQTTSPPMTQPSQGGGVSQQILSTSGLAQQPTKAQPLPTRLPVEQQPAAGAPVVTSSQVAPNVPPNLPADSAPGLAQSSPPVQGGSGPGLAPVQGTQPPASAQYACLSSVTATQLEDARRLLFQHQALLSLPKMAAGECAPETGTSLGPEGSSAVNALAASVSLFPLKDGEEDSSSGASVVAIDNKIEQAMDLVKSHLMYAVREEVEVLKEQIKELIERNSQLEQENNLLKTLASPEQLAQFQAQVQSGSPPASAQPPGAAAQQPAPPAQPASQSSGPSA